MKPFASVLWLVLFTADVLGAPVQGHSIKQLATRADPEPVDEDIDINSSSKIWARTSSSHIMPERADPEPVSEDIDINSSSKIWARDEAGALPA